MSKATALAPHLDAWPVPPWLAAAIKEIGQREVSGPRSNPRILEYRTMGRTPFGGDDGAVPWCAIFVNAMLEISGVQGSGSAMARSYVSSPYFKRLKTPVVGCITVLSSRRGPASGHVTFYTAENTLNFQGLGGNQDDAVGIDTFPKALLVGHFWPRAYPLPGSPFDRPVRRALAGADRRVTRDA